MNDKLILSIIIPVFNGEKFIERALKSILSQASDDYEVIIVNDGSTDFSAEIIEKYEKNFEVVKVVHTCNQGVCCTRNIGIELAKGKYLFFFDQDDIFFKDAFDSELLVRLNSYYKKGIDVLCFRFVKSDESINYFDTMETAIQTSKDKRIYMISGLPTHFAFYNERLFRENQIRFMKSRYIDLDMQLTHLLFYYADKIVFDNSLLLYCWIIHHESEGHNSKNFEKKYYDAIKYWKKTADIHSREGDASAQRYCEDWVRGVFYHYLRGYYKTHIAIRPIKTLINELQIDDLIRDYKHISNDEIRNGIQCFYHNRIKLIAESRMDKYKYRIGLFLVRHLELVKNKYLRSKYPLTWELLLKCTAYQQHDSID